MPYLLLASLLFGVAAAFAVVWWNARSQIANLTASEKWSESIEAIRAQRERKTLRQRIDARLRLLGLDGDPAVPAASVFLLWVVLTLAASALGLPPVVAGIAGVPAAALVVWAVVRRARVKRRRQFNDQLLQMLDMMSNSLATGMPVQRAMDEASRRLGEPLRPEIAQALDRVSGGGQDLVDSLSVVAERYPSRAMALLMTALRVDRATGAPMRESLFHAADSLRRDKELAAEALADLAETKMQAWGIIAIISGIAMSMVASGSSNTQVGNPYMTPVGIAGLVIAASMIAFGGWFFLHLINKAKGSQ